MVGGAEGCEVVCLPREMRARISAITVYQGESRGGLLAAYVFWKAVQEVKVRGWRTLFERGESRIPFHDEGGQLTDLQLSQENMRLCGGRGRIRLEMW